MIEKILQFFIFHGLATTCVFFIWNTALVKAISFAQNIDWWQSLMIYALCGILFKQTVVVNDGTDSKNTERRDFGSREEER